MLINGAQQFVYNGPTLIGNISSNGNGYADWTLRTVDLSSFNDGDEVLFHATWDEAVDGGESFFLLGAPGSGVGVVPLPAALPLAATGFGVLGIVGWFRRRAAGA